MNNEYLYINKIKIIYIKELNNTKKYIYLYIYFILNYSPMIFL